MRLPQAKDQSTESLRNPVWFREWFKIIMREWAASLTMQQLAVVLFVFDRTAAWGKEWEYIRFTSFVEGITSKDGSMRYSAGICTSTATAMRLTKELVSMGYLRKDRTRLGNRWALNYDFNTKDTAMRRVKRQTNIASMQDPNIASMQGYNRTTNVEDEEATQTNLRRSAAERGSSSSSIQDALARARGKAQAARDRQELRKQGKMNSTQVATAWTASLQKADWITRSDIASGRMYLSKKEAQALKSYSDRFRKNYPGKPFKEFLEWVIVNWQEIRTELFGWMTKAPAPESPAALFIIKFADKLEQRYMQGLAFEHKLSTEPTVRRVKARPKTQPISAKPKPFPTRKKHKPLPSLPSMDDDYLAKEYES